MIGKQWISILMSACFFAACTNKINVYCKLNNKDAHRSPIYRDIDFFGLTGIDKISCDSAKKSNFFIFFMNYYHDSLDVIAIKPSNDKRHYYLKRERSANTPLFTTNLLNLYKPVGKNFDTIVVANKSQFIIHRAIRSRSPTHLYDNEYYIWEKLAANRMAFYHYSSNTDRPFDINDRANTGRLHYRITYEIQNGNLMSERMDAASDEKITKKTEPFESFFTQIFLASL